MDLETQQETDGDVESERLFVADLNQATAEELDALPGIGRSLARRIVAYREERGGFHALEELAAVPGLSRAVYERLADRLTVVPPETALPPAAGEAVSAEPPEVAVALPGAPVVQETVLPEVEEAAPEKRILPVEKPPAAEKAPAPPRVEPAAPPPAPPPVHEPPRQRGSLSWLWSALLGGLFGLVFTLLVFAGINGSLDLNNSRAVLDVQNRVNTLAAEATSLRGEIDGLRQRLDTLEGLTARMDKAESAVETLRQETVGLDQRADALESELASVAEEFSTVQAQTQRVTTFFERLQALLRDVFGDEGASGPTPAPPVETPLPND
jgi:competence ComEA-like helix-hairpin-helix protein